MKDTLRSLLADRALLNEMREDPGLLVVPDGTEAASLDRTSGVLDQLLAGNESAISDSADFTATEAIILLRGRPVLLIQDETWQQPASAEIRGWLGRPDDPQNLLRPRIPSVGRIEVIDFETDYIGTGWMLDESTMITNRHVVEEFGLRKGSGFDFQQHPDGRRYSARVDFRREHQRDALARAGIEEILFLEEGGDLRPDMALLRLAAGGTELPHPIELDDAPLRIVDPDDRPKLAVIGYPAEDGRNDASAMRQIFDGIYRVKRLSPGRLMSVAPNGRLLEHDCSTLGGNSGSPVIDLETGKACGIHFKGTYRDRNFAVTAAWLKSRLHELSARSTFTFVSAGGALEAAGPKIRPAGHFAGRQGYSAGFLGNGDLEVPLPQLHADLEDQVAPVAGSPDGLLDYTHFSIKMNKDRRMPFFTACNIDGNQLFNIPRGRDAWFLDGRLATAHQTGEDLYRSNNLDRGHLVRRLDPVWGATRPEGQQAELDTFVFPNCTPQHADLNQQTWLSLEDYILGNSNARNFKVSVFTGPVFAEDDLVYRGIRIPKEFWKVAVMVNDETGQLSATGYLLSQADLLGDIEFVLGAFRTYQVALSVIEKKTGLSFDLSLFDPMGATEGLGFREVRSPEDIVY